MIFIAVPFFNRADYLKETLLSVRSQSDPRFEVWVLDDSVDPAEAKAAQAVCSELGIRYHKNAQNLGLAQNWNQAISIAQDHRFQYLLILHADDRLKPHFVREVLAAFEADATLESVFTQVEVIDLKGNPKFSLADQVKNWIRPRGTQIELIGEDGVKTLLNGDYIFCPTICYRVAALGTRRFDPALKQVLDFKWIVDSLLSGSKWVGLYREPLYEYRRHSQSLTGQQSVNFVRYHEEIEFYRWVAKELKDRGEWGASVFARLMWMVRASIIVDGLTSLVRGRFSRTAKLIRLAFCF